MTLLIKIELQHARMCICNYGNFVYTVSLKYNSGYLLFSWEKYLLTYLLISKLTYKIDTGAMQTQTQPDTALL